MPNRQPQPWRENFASYLPEDPSAEDLVRWAGAWLKWDLRLARRSLFQDVVAGSVFTPRLLRWWIYRRCGLDVNTPSIQDHCVFRVDAFSIASRSGIGSRCHFEGIGSVTIGHNSMIGFGTTFITSHHPSGEDGKVLKRPEGRPIVVGDHVWIGAGCIVTPGAVIGDNCTIAAGAVVTGHLEGGHTYGGVPARRIDRSRRVPAD